MAFDSCSAVMPRALVHAARGRGRALHPGAAGSLREGMDDTAHGDPAGHHGQAPTHVESTNPWESMIDTVPSPAGCAPADPSRRAGVHAITWGCDHRRRRLQSPHRGQLCLLHIATDSAAVVHFRLLRATAMRQSPLRLSSLRTSEATSGGDRSGDQATLTTTSRTCPIVLQNRHYDQHPRPLPPRLNTPMIIDSRPEERSRWR